MVLILINNLLIMAHGLLRGNPGVYMKIISFRVLTIIINLLIMAHVVLRGTPDVDMWKRNFKNTFYFKQICVTKNTCNFKKLPC